MTKAVAGGPLLSIVVIVITSCLPIPSARSFETAVMNSGATAYVVGVQVPEQFHFVDRYYAVPPGQTVVVDTAS